MTKATLEQASRPLTERELEMLRLAADSRSNRQIAAEMGTTEQTVKNRFGKLFARLGVGDRAGACVMAVRKGWIE